MRKALFAAITACFVFATIELAACAGLRVHSGTWHTPSSLAELRAGISSTELGVPGGARARRRVRQLEALFEDTVIHPYIGFVNDPAISPGWRRGRPLSTSDLGFPSNITDPLEAPDEGHGIVFVTGGSVAQLFAYRTEALARELERIPRFADKEVKVVAMANGGFKQPQQLMALNYLLLLGASPDLVINLDGFNEVALPGVDLLPYGIHPTYPRVWAHRMGAFDPKLRRSLGEFSFLQELRRDRARQFGGALGYSMTAGLVWHVIDRRFERRQHEAQSRLSNPELALEGYQMRGPSYEGKSDEELEQLLIDIWSRASVMMEQLCRARGIEYFHFLQPNQYVEGSKPLSAEEKRLAWKEDKPYRRGVETGYPRLRAAGRDLRDQGVRFHDLTNVFADSSQTLYIDDCCHFNAAGDRLLAREIADAIIMDEGAAR